MRKNKFIPSLLFLLCLCLAVSLMPVNSVGAVDYYNLLENPSFAQYTEYVSDVSFESGSYGYNVTYGAFCQNPDNATESGIFSLGNPYSGVYGMSLEWTTFNQFWYNFTTGYEPLGADVAGFSMMIDGTNNGWHLYIRYYYTDDSYDTTTDLTFTDEYAQYDIVADYNDINTAKYITAIEVWCEKDCYVDDFSFLVDDGNAQDTLSMSTSPWYHLQDDHTYPASCLVLHAYAGHGRLDDFCYTACAMETTSGIGQSIPYVDSNDVYFLNMYIWQNHGEGAEVGMTARIVYSDGTSNSKTETVLAGDSVWTLLNFGGSWISTNKIIVRLELYLGSSDMAGWNIMLDDIGLWSSVSVAYSRFNFILSPTAVSQTATGFIAYQKSSYTFYGYLYNSTGSLCLNGTYALTTSYGSASGSISMGQFNFAMAQRVGSGSDFTEDIGIVLQVTDTGLEEVFVVSLRATWKSSGSPSSSDTGYDAETFDNDMVSMLVNWLVIGLPAMILGIATKNVMVMIFGLTIGLGAGYLAGIVDIWLILLMGVLCIVMMYAGRPR